MKAGGRSLPAAAVIESRGDGGHPVEPLAQEILVFGNPISGMGRGLRIAQDVVESASRAGCDARLYLEHPATIPDDWMPRSPDGVVVAIGGDGTLRCVVDRLLKYFDASSASRMPSLLAVPLGTANLVAGHLHSRWRPSRTGAEVLEAICKRTTRKLDIATVNGQAMLAVAGVGFDAAVIHELSSTRRGPITYADYLIPTVRSIARYRFRPLTVSIDGHELIHDTPAIAFIGNIPEYGAGFSVTPMAKSDDGMLDLCVLPCGSLQELFELGVICGTGLQAGSERSMYQRGRHIEIAASEPVPVQIDGEESGFTPASFDLLDRQLTFIVPNR